MNTQTQTRVFSLFNASGQIEELSPIPALPYGCKVHIFGAGMLQSIGAVCSDRDQYGRYKVVKITDFEEEYKNFCYLDQYARPLSQKFGIGIYYADNLETFSADYVREHIAQAEQAQEERAKAEKRQAEADEQERADLPKLYPYLTPNPRDEDKITKANILALLRHNFPGVKFSARKRHYSSYTISWINGPQTCEVAKLTGKFEDHETDFTGDFRDPSPTNFTRVFGGFKYIFEERTQSEDIKALLPQLVELLNGYDREYPEQIFYRIFSRTHIPANAYGFRIERTNVTCGNIAEFYGLVFDVREDTAPAPVTGSNGAELRINEQKNGIEVIFSAKPATEILDALKSKGFRWSRFAGLWYAINTPDRLTFAKTLIG